MAPPTRNPPIYLDDNGEPTAPPSAPAPPAAAAPSTGLKPVVTNPANAAGRGVPIEQYIRAWQAQFGVAPDQAGFDTLISHLRNEGYDVKRADHNGEPSKDKLDIGNGNGLDLIGSEGTANASWAYQPYSNNGGGGGAAADIAGLGAGSLLQPFTENFSREPFKPPPDFVAPTGDQVFEDPGFKFRLDQGRQALERSAAAKGTLLTTGTLKDLDSFSQGAASQEYGNVYARRAGEYESQYGKAVDTYARDYNQALGEYGIKKDNFFTNQDRPFNKLSTLAGFGTVPSQNYAGQYGSLMMNGANQQGNYLTGAANANAAGIVGGSNAWTNAFGNLSNLGAQYASIYSNPWSRGPQQQMPWQGVPYR